jgi:plasmid replication initiation protein
MSKKLEVFKNVELVNATYKLSLLEQQMIIYAIARGREDDSLVLDRIFHLNVAEFSKTFGYEKQHDIYNRLKAASFRFFERYVKLAIPDADFDGTEITNVHWLALHSYNDAKGVISIKFNEFILPHITRLDGKLKPYISYRLDSVCEITNIYAMRLYEQMMKFIWIGKMPLEVSWIRENFGLTEKYKTMSNFKMRVIDTAVKQINECSDIFVSYTEIKDGRNIIAFIFTIRQKHPTSEVEAKAEAKKQKQIEKNNSTVFSDNNPNKATGKSKTLDQLKNPPRSGESLQAYQERLTRECNEADIKAARRKWEQGNEHQP